MASCILPTIFEVSEFSDSCAPSFHETGSDSDTYDTDLESEDVKSGGKTNNRKDMNGDYYVCKQVYINSCLQSKTNWSSTGVVPQTKVADSLATKTINLQYRSLGAAHMSPLARSLKNNMRVERLILDGCDIQAEGMKSLAEGLADNVTVQYLNLANNNLGYEGAKWVAYLLLKNKIIKHAILSGNKFGDDTSKFIGSIIEVNNTLTYLDLSHNDLQETGGQIIGAALGENYRLDTLRLGWNSLRNQGAVAIGQSLQYNDTLKVLDVNMNGFGYGGALALRVSLKKNKTLRELDVSNNSINWKGAELIARGLKENSDLEVLRIGKNSLTTTGCMDLVEAVSVPSSTVKLLDIQGVSITEETEMMAAAISAQREFRIHHGGVVRCRDILGVRDEKEPDHMNKLLQFIKSSMMRPLELLKDFDKSANVVVSEEEFVKRMVKVGVPLHRFQMRELAREICGQLGTDEVDYKTLSDAVGNQILRNRSKLYKEREEKKKLKAYNENILDSGLPALDIPNKNLALRTGMSGSVTRSSRETNHSQDDFTMTSFPDVLDGLLVGKLVKDDKEKVVSKKTVTLSMSASLGDCEDKKPKKKKKLKFRLKKKKKPLDYPEGGTCVARYS